MSVIVTTTFQRGQGLDMFSKFVSFQGMFTTQTTTALLKWSFSHVCQMLVSGGQMEVQIYPPLWTVSLGGLVGHNSHREKTGQQWLQMLQVILKANSGFNHCRCPDLLLHRKKNMGMREFPIFGHLGRFNVKASGYDKLTATVLVVLV